MFLLVHDIHCWNGKYWHIDCFVALSPGLFFGPLECNVQCIKQLKKKKLGVGGGPYGPVPLSRLMSAS